MMICPQCGVRVAYDATSCYNCSLDLIQAEVEESKKARKFTFTAVAAWCIGVIVVAYVIVEGPRYYRWNQYHTQLKKLNSYDATIGGAPSIPVPPDDPAVGSLNRWFHKSDPYSSDLRVDNSTDSKN